LSSSSTVATPSESPESRRKRLEQAIAALEAQRAILGDEAADAAIGLMRRELSALDAPETAPDRRKESQRRVVTILFSDVTGSTAMAESMDPETWTEIMNGAFERLIEPVERFGGTVARLMGDAILAFFGAPVAHEDDPQRAVLAGLAILESIRPFRERLQKEEGLSFDVRVGINTGLAVVGDVGSDTAGEYTAMGDAVNLAARMEQTASPGTVQIAENTYRLVTPFFEFEALGGIAVKGKSEPVQSYRVVGRRAAPGRIRGIEGLESPLIGREREKVLLDELISRLGQEEGGAIVCLTGEAGLGKSRLIRELRDSADPECRWYEAAMLSYESGQPYRLFERFIRRLVGLASSDTPTRMRERLQELVRLFPNSEQEEVGRLFESLFRLSGESEGPPLEGEAFKGRLFTAMTAIWEEQLSRGPLVLVFDDLHWVDPASAALLQHLLPLVERGPLIIVLAMRPSAQSPGWAVKEVAETEFSHRCTSLQLEPLSAEEGSQLVENLLTISDLPQRLRTLIQEKTEGNPFFVEEVVRTLIDDGIVVRDESGMRWRAGSKEGEIHIPDNVQALLVARIDRLEEAARNTLQLAAVVGRSFYYRVLAHIIDMVDDLSAQLLTLEKTQFIQEAARRPELEYIFRHALTQEAAYSAILLRQRRVYHRRVGETLESLFPDRQEELAGALAFHFFQAHDFERALHYYTVAGDVAFRLFAVVEAIDFYSRALDCAGKVDAVANEQLIHLYTRRGRAYELDNKFDEALANYQVMIELARERDDRALRLASLTAQLIIRATGTPLHDPPQAKALANEALSLAQELGDRATEARVLWGLLLLSIYSGVDPELGEEYGRRSLAIAREIGDTEQIAYTLHNMTTGSMAQEQFEEARRTSLEARAVWLELGNTPMLADSYLSTASLHMFAGDFEAAISDAREAIRISRSIGNKWIQSVAPFYTSLALLEQGDVDRSLEKLRQGLEMAEQEGITFFRFAGTSHQILLYWSAGAFDRADPLVEKLYRDRDQMVFGFFSSGLTRAARIKLALGDLTRAQQIQADSLQDVDKDSLMLYFVAEVTVTGALLHLALDRPEEALSEAQWLVERTRRAGLKSNLTEALLVQGRALAALDELEGAAAALREAAQVAEEIGQRRLLWQILAVLAEVETRQGNAAAAQTARGRAREVIDYIARHAGDSGLRESFLALPEVQSVLSPD
jgi:class 3 adenylate cyclase/tetratricopeptide (TPR) repeat protein